MISVEFTNRLKERFPKINNGVITDILEELEKYDDQAIKQIWDTFNRSYKNVSPPQFGAIYESIKESGAKRQSYGPKADRVFKCEDCGTYYAQTDSPLSAYCCPNCLSLERTVSDKSKDMKVFYIQSVCTCGWGHTTGMEEDFRTRSKCPNMGEYRSYGPTCSQCGTGYNGQECYDCLCRTCCGNAKKQDNELSKEAEKGEKKNRNATYQKSAGNNNNHDH